MNLIKINKNFLVELPFTTGLKMMLAAVLAFLSYYFIPSAYGYWAVVTIAAITQAGFSKTLTKSMMRLLGTVIGAAVGYGFALVAKGNIFIILAIFFLFTLLSSWIAIQKTNASYGGVIAGLTLVIVLSSSLLSGQLFGMAVLRSFEVIVGIVALLLVNLCLAFIIDGHLQSSKGFIKDMLSIPGELRKLTYKKEYLLAAFRIALACSLTFGVWLYFQQPQGFWAAVSCLLVMEESFNETQTKSLLRFWAHVIAAFFGAIFALVLGDYLLLRLIPLSIAFFVCGYIIGMKTNYSSLGNTTGIALAIMLLVGVDTQSSFEIITARFLNVIFGIAVALLITHFFANNKLKLKVHGR